MSLTYRHLNDVLPQCGNRCSTFSFIVNVQEGRSNLSLISPTLSHWKGKFSSGSTAAIRRCDASVTAFEISAVATDQVQDHTQNGGPHFSGAEQNRLAVIHKQLEKEGGVRNSFAQFGSLDGQDTSTLVSKIKEMRRKTMQLMEDKSKRSAQQEMSYLAFSCGIDPEYLKNGEYVVHKTKGIGRFFCLKDEIPEGKESPVKYVYLQYADGMAKLKAKQAARLLSRYHQPGERGKVPSLSKLNDQGQWERKMSKGRLAVQKMVMDLMQLYVHRLRQRRPPYAKNRQGMAEFAEKCPYLPTPDQEQAFSDVERDMTEREIPMDRLICGDVGFGKTEVALRAIFQVVSLGKQVMVLAPTTVLAKQHYKVICNRFAGYKFQVALLCRFQTSSEKKKLIAHIREGVLDIVVGTHTLLGGQIHYNNLGLLVVDEEQRFGVKQKECIASFKTSVDVLTLSATPIPRTLYLALTGFRDASMITTPPPERVPIKTHLSEYNEGKVKAAIEFEISRGGQIFYVLPRITGLAKKKTTLEANFPGIKVGVVHGKQKGTILEETMEKFADGGNDILLCTNIIESGLDIQTVNTIIVEDAHLFGLAQLYQLRGRVGRAEKQAHAYLFYPCKDFLSDKALERLVALEECCLHGQGFHLAERDMAIRGFGSIFGERQSGEEEDIGMDLFLEFLFESLTKLDIEFKKHIPSDYIQDCQRRESMPHDLDAAAAKGIIELMHFTNNLRVEFGKEPPSVEVLLKAIYVKRMAADLGIYHIWTRSKTSLMETNMSEAAFELLKESMTSENLRSAISFHRGQIQLQVLLEHPCDHKLEQIFICLADLYNGLTHFVK